MSYMERPIKFKIELILFFFLDYNYIMVFRRRPRFSMRRRKRWYVNASANLPFVGRTSVGFGSGKGKRSFNQRVVKTIRNHEEPKHKMTSTNQTLKQNTIYTANIMGNIPIGTGSSSRIGDEVFIEAIKFRNYFEQLAAIENTLELRMMIVEHDSDYAAGSDAFSDAALGTSDLFQSGTATNGTILGIHDPKKVTVHFDKVFELNKSVTGKVRSHLLEMTLPIKKKFIYKTGTDYGKFKNWYIVVSGFASGATTGVTDVGFFQLTSDLIIKDD